MSLEMFGNQNQANRQTPTQPQGQTQTAPVQQVQKNMGFDEFSLL